MIKIDDVVIPFDSAWKKIAVGVSGGADSALLLYLISSNIIDSHTEIFCISNIRCWRTRPWHDYHSLMVFEWMRDKFQHIKFHRKTNIVAPDLEYNSQGSPFTDEYGKKTSGDNLQMRAFAEYTCHTEDIPVYFNAVTRNPRNVNFQGMSERDVEPDSNNSHLVVTDHIGILACHPFRFIEKNWILKQYHKHKIMDLFYKTRSCEGEFEGLDYKTYKPGIEVPTCGECYWCKEREWALEQIKK